MSTLAYDRRVDRYVRSPSAPYTVIGNPGQPYWNRLSTQDYLSVANVFDVFEGPNSAPSGSPGSYWDQEVAAVAAPS